MARRKWIDVCLYVVIFLVVYCGSYLWFRLRFSEQTLEDAGGHAVPIRMFYGAPADPPLKGTWGEHAHHSAPEGAVKILFQIYRPLMTLDAGLSGVEHSVYPWKIFQGPRTK